MILDIAKYVFTLILIVIGAMSSDHRGGIFCSGLFELSAIFALGEILILKHPVAAQISNNILILILNAQFAVLKLGGTYISTIMLTNIHALGALKGGKTVIYVTVTILVLVFSFLPICQLVKDRKIKMTVFAGTLAADIVICTVIGSTCSAFASVSMLGAEAYEQHQMNEKIQKLRAENADGAERTYKDPVDNGYKYADLDHLPNIVLIFTEGMSQSIVEDSRNIMPNVRQYESQSVFFSNYYNHTAATYRGIPCELYSGFQLDDMDDNHLASLEEVLGDYGYDTTLINPENHQKDFAEHLSRLGFDHYINGDKTDYAMSDKQMYEEAYKLLTEKNTTGQPKLITMYTFGTHIGQDSPDEKFQDGSSSILNRFYNVDYQFGQFMQKIRSNTETDQTVVVFTTDHASYTDDDFKNAFPDVERGHGFCDRIPLMIWYEGVQPAEIDVNGRTSIDMAPTILDYFNMKQPDDFLGTSLFASEPSDEDQKLIETTFGIPVSSNYLSTDGGDLHTLTDKQKEKVVEIVAKYCAAAAS